MIHTRPDFAVAANPNPLMSRTRAKISENAAMAVLRTAPRTSLKPILRGGLGLRAIVSRTKPATEEPLLCEIEAIPVLVRCTPRVERTRHGSESLEDRATEGIGNHTVGVEARAEHALRYEHPLRKSIDALERERRVHKGPRDSCTCSCTKCITCVGSELEIAALNRVGQIRHGAANEVATCADASSWCDRSAGRRRSRPRTTDPRCRND